MCPPALPLSPAEIGLYWTEEQVISSLAKYTGGSCLPNNVLADLSPYQYLPSVLPEGIWYLVSSNEKKESVHGFWKAKGEPCLIYSNSGIRGWRTLLEYFEGLAPHGQRTDWLMQEYGITQQELCDKTKPKVSKLLCRVFLCSGHSSRNVMQAKDCQTDVKPKQTNSVALLIPKTNLTSPQDSSGESKANRECEAGLFPMANRQPNFNQLDLYEAECLSKGDFLALSDLEDPESHSSSSQNSSCPSKLSDEYFDSLALLRDLEEDANKQMPGKHSTSYLTTSVRPNDVVLQPSLLGCVNDSPTSPSSTVLKNLQDKTVHDQATKGHKLEDRNEGTSNVCEALAPSNVEKKAPSNGEKKSGAGSMKKLAMYLCFASF